MLTARKTYKCRSCKVTYKAKPDHTVCPVCQKDKPKRNK